MGLKIENLNPAGVIGEVDGLPFSLEVSANRWSAALGDKASPVWEGAAEIEPVDALKGHGLGDIRQMAYWALAVYRDATRPRMATA